MKIDAHITNFNPVQYQPLSNLIQGLVENGKNRAMIYIGKAVADNLVKELGWVMWQKEGHAVNFFDGYSFPIQQLDLTQSMGRLLQQEEVMNISIFGE